MSDIFANITFLFLNSKRFVMFFYFFYGAVGEYKGVIHYVPT